MCEHHTALHKEGSLDATTASDAGGFVLCCHVTA